MDFATLEKYKTLQRELNSLLKLDGKSLLLVDGRIGPKTVSALSNYVGGYSHCDQVAAAIDAVIASVKTNVLGRNAPPVADPPRSKDAASKVDPKTGEMTHPPDTQTAGLFGMPWWMLLAAGITGYLVYSSTGPAKKKRKRKAPAKRKTTRRKRRVPKTRTTITRYY
jgi:hypothetical protein